MVAKAKACERGPADIFNSLSVARQLLLLCIHCFNCVEANHYSISISAIQLHFPSNGHWCIKAVCFHPELCTNFSLLSWLFEPDSCLYYELTVGLNIKANTKFVIGECNPTILLFTSETLIVENTQLAVSALKPVRARCGVGHKRKHRDGHW